MSLFSKAQPNNLIPNPSFEIMSGGCPNGGLGGYGQIDKADGWFQPNGLPNQPLNGGSTDIFSTCFNCCQPQGAASTVPSNLSTYQFPRTGANYCGFGNANPDSIMIILGPSAEYLEVKLIDTLNVSKKYCVSWYWSSANYVVTKTDAMHGVFTSDTLKYNSPNFQKLVMPPSVYNTKGNILSDTANWNLFSQVYVAQGGELFLTIGDFWDKDSCSYINTNPITYAPYFLYDDFSIYELPEITTNNDTTICYGDTGQLLVNCSGCWQGNTYEWRDDQGNLIGMGSTLNVSPMQTSTYFVNVIDTTNTVPCISEAKDSIKITVIGTPSNIEAGLNAMTCMGDTIQLGMMPNSNATYSWQPITGIIDPNQSSTQLIVSTTQTYTLTQAETQSGCTVVNKDSVTVSLKPTAIANILLNDLFVCKDDSVNLIAQTYSNTSCEWYMNGLLKETACDFSFLANNNTSVIFRLNDTGNNYCIDQSTDTINVQVSNCDTLFSINIPNVFTPNADGINDVFEINFENASLQGFKIYNRWGNEIYNSDDVIILSPSDIKSALWTGRTSSGVLCANGTYFYVITVITAQEKSLTYKGFVQLL